MQAKLKSKLSMIMELEQALFSVVRYIHIQTKNNFHVVPVMEESWEQTFLRSAVNWGMLSLITSPSLFGVNPTSEFTIAFSMAFKL